MFFEDGSSFIREAAPPEELESEFFFGGAGALPNKPLDDFVGQ